LNAYFVVVLISVLLISGFSFTQQAFGQGVKTAGGVDVDGTWYVGEGLKQGDYFHYRLCELSLNDCADFDMKLWFKGETQKGTETLWLVETVVLDGNKIVKGEMELGKVAPEPVGTSGDLFDYSIAFKSSIVWLSAFATSDPDDLIHGPQAFRDVAWGKVAAIGGSQLIPWGVEPDVTVGAGTFDTVLIGWYSGYGQGNLIWVVDDFPFPIKALVYVWVTTGTPPIQYQFELLDYKENVNSSPFTDVVPTAIVEKTKPGCPSSYDSVNGIKSTDSFSMIVEYRYGPEHPMPGCDIEWKISFKNRYNQVEWVNEVHYDIQVIDDEGFTIRSMAQEEGRNALFNGFGQLHRFIEVKEPPGTAHYVILVYGVGPKQIVPSPEFSGLVKVDVVISGEVTAPTEGGLDIPNWVKNNAGWWSNGQIGDTDFVSGIQYLINKGIMKIPPTTPGSGPGSNEIPAWIKNNAGWWSNGLISDQDFVSGIQYLITNNIIKITL